MDPGRSCLGGKSVSFQNQPITWTAITASGTYRLLVRVRAGYVGDHTFYVKPNVDYAATVDGEKRPFTLLPDTLAYHGDEANFVWLTTEPFSLSQGMHTLLISAGPTYAKLDVLGLTEDPEFVPPAAPPFGQETPNDLRLLPDDEQRQAYRGYTVWTRLPEQNVAPTDRPDDVMGVDALALAAAGNEYEAANLIVTNWQDTALTLRLQVGDLAAGKEGPRLSGQRFELLEAIPLPAFDGRWLADPLPPLAAGVWTIPPRESRQAWLRLHTRDLPPGTYTGKLTLDPVSASDQRLLRTLTFTVTIHPFSLPQQHPLFVFLNEYDLDFPGVRADLAAHYVNVFHVCKVPGPDGVPDFTAHDAEVRSELQYAPQINFEHWWFRDRSDWKTAEGRARWQQWSRTWATHLWDDLGLTPDRVWLHIYDEQGGAAVDDYIAARQLLEEVTPAVQDVVTVASWTTLEEIQRMNPYADIWSPSARTIGQRRGDGLLPTKREARRALHLCREQESLRSLRVFPPDAVEDLALGIPRLLDLDLSARQCLERSRVGRRYGLSRSGWDRDQPALGTVQGRFGGLPLPVPPASTHRRRLGSGRRSGTAATGDRGSLGGTESPRAGPPLADPFGGGAVAVRVRPIQFLLPGPENSSAVGC